MVILCIVFCRRFHARGLAMTPVCQHSLLDTTDHEAVYQPRPADLFRPQRIIFAKGSVSTPQRRSLAERICSAYPNAEVEEQLTTAHNKIDLGIADPLQLH